MAEDIYTFDADAVRKIRELWEWYERVGRNLKPNTGGSGGGNDPNAPFPPPDRSPMWGYVVLTPQAGIPALDITAGTDTGTGTGDEPGSVNCQVWKRDLINGGLTYAGFDIDVYNLGDVAVPGTIYVMAVRDAFGDFYVGLPIQTETC